MAEKNLPVAAPRLAALLEAPHVKKRFDELLGKRSAQFTSSLLSVVNNNKLLASCEPMSIIAAAMVAASMDLPINQNLGFAWIVPYNGVAQFQLGWKGYVQLALRSGQYRTINSTEVYEGQLVDDNPFTGAMRFQRERTSDKVVGYLLYFRLLNGFEKYCYITREDAEKHGKQYSKAYQKNYGPWKDDFDAMALKTVVKNGLAKWGILSIEMQTALAVDQGEIIEGEAVRYPDAVDNEGEAPDEQPKKKAGSRVKALIEQDSALPPDGGHPGEYEPLPFENDDLSADQAYAVLKDK